MSPFEAYQEYLSLKNHFTMEDYSYHKYNGKTSVKISSYNKRKDKIFFEKLAKQEDVHGFLLANFSANSKVWIKELAFSPNAEKTYKEWVKKQQSLTYIFKLDIEKLNDNFDENFKCVNNEHPILLKKYLNEEISLETICILLALTGALRYWNREMEYDIIWAQVKNRIRKYIPFIKVDKQVIRKIVFDKYS